MDNATYSQNNRFKGFCKRNKIIINFTSIRHLQSNLLNDVFKKLLKFLRIFVKEDHRNWDDKIEENGIFY